MDGIVPFGNATYIFRKNMTALIWIILPEQNA